MYVRGYASDFVYRAYDSEKRVAAACRWEGMKTVSAQPTSQSAPTTSVRGLWPDVHGLLSVGPFLFNICPYPLHNSVEKPLVQLCEILAFFRQFVHEVVLIALGVTLSARA